jgi:protein-S-isoprenylcysteine O-methyltransferase Ste14
VVNFTMNPWNAKAVVLLAILVMVTIRVPHGQRSRSVRVAKSRRGFSEFFVLSVARLGFFFPILWITTPMFAFADYPLHPVLFFVGVLGLGAGLWLFQRAHADLATNWSATLELRENHKMVTDGAYRLVRHPMYLAVFLYSAGMGLALPNWIAGPAYLVKFTLLFASRVRAEERMMLEEFGKNYEAYMGRTHRLVPGIW